MKSISRRKFVVIATSLGSGVAMRNIVPQQLAGTQPHHDLAHDPERPQFHLLPARNWMNDPNGPIYFNGHYHLFFQYNPQSAISDNKSWDHAVSPDMLHWTHEGLALTETPGGPDAAGCFSGSCIAVDEHGHKRVYAIYTGVVKDTVRLTIQAEGLRESQCLAWSDDPMLRTWTKRPEPVIAAPPATLKVTGFRDPSAWKSGDWFYLTVGSGIAGVGGCVLLYRSKDLRSWEYLHVLTGAKSSGIAASNPVESGDMWECPDFFPLDHGYILIYSTMGKVYWQSGTLDEATLLFHPAQSGLLDLATFYAPKTQLDAQGRRILWGWIPERRSDAAMLKAGWSGMMSLPRVLTLDPDGMLRIEILPEIQSLRDGTLPLVTPRTGTLPQASGELLCTGRRGTDFSLELNAGTVPLLDATYDAATHTVRVEGKEVVLSSTDEPVLHGFVDCSVLELMIADRICYTKRFYPGSAIAPDIHVQVEAATLQLWKIAPISPDRLTTPAKAAAS